MSQVVLKHVTKTFNKQNVIEDMTLTIPSGSFTVLVGPSGCGKSTTLRIIAGLEQPTSGDIFIDGQKVNEVEPGKRDIAMVFQNYALYPTMTVKQNIEFGLKNRKVPKQERNQLIAEIAEVVGLSEYLNRKPSELSGGQRQRVALARAMVKKPKVFLMDEPLSNLDAQLRQQMRIELMELHKKLGTTFIYVTHDQVEAMSMGDQIVVLNKGEIQQAASPMEMYDHPANQFVATFIGNPPMNLFKPDWNTIKFPETLSVEHHQVQAVGIRPEKIRLHPINHHVQKSNSLVFHGTILAHEMLGGETLYYLETGFGRLTVKDYHHRFYADKQIQVELPYSDLHFFDEKGKRICRDSAALPETERAAR
jgi:sn-glycerol 3-phosphate transport system ATP-binding protein